MALSPSSGFVYYISLLGNQHYKQLFESKQNVDYLASFTEEKAAYRYAPGKWSVKQIVGHMADHERIMMYRALRFSRNDSTPQPGYDQEVLVNHANFDATSFQNLLLDYTNVRAGSLSFINMLTEKQLERKGIASGIEISVQETLQATIGHELHHIKIIKERY